MNQTPPPEGEKLHSDSGISVDSQSLHDQQPHTQTAASQGKQRGQAGAAGGGAAIRIRCRRAVGGAVWGAPLCGRMGVVGGGNAWERSFPGERLGKWKLRQIGASRLIKLIVLQG